MSTAERSGSLPSKHAHIVQFYGEDGVLLHELENYIGTALADGGSAIIIATVGHNDNLTHRLKSQGIDVAKTIAEGRYISLDATEVLSTFMVDGQPDAARFSET